ncbi:hypothetical protein BBBOND_0301290 [Babesia bigemina]|uniref:Uncharacterized protein n=1 Tax=Babesia bigemina TaxID=5866 RepID=A0A061DBE7_BABBI|nr:hypothetical protein BBBOND_0301290 [Babesia bigemina]CDR96224.1 hypothetical protein BBBOND_0301290 [Babesia bigemina]|eukprot:XP_012768410.1 hypothetical protein BBBOND_0301290 [Babesia bigemina]
MGLTTTISVHLRVADAFQERHRKDNLNETESTNICGKKVQGVAFLTTDKNNPAARCNVTLLLENKTLHVLKGNTDLKRFVVGDIKTPVLIVRDECLSIQNDISEDVLCFPNRYSLESWWMAITKQILCNHQGKVRNEMYGEATLEEIHADVESLYKGDQRRGINIRIDGDDPSKLPQIKVHYRE